MEYTIQDAASYIGVAASTLRYYDKEGLLPFLQRSDSGIRIFKKSDLEWLQLIECLKTTGLAIKDIKRFIDLYAEGDSTLALRRDMFLERKRVVEAQMEELQKNLDFVTYKCWFYEEAASAGSAEVPKNMKPEEIPKDIVKMKENAGL